MEKKIASIVILIQNDSNTNLLNSILSEYGKYILGRQGINILHRKISIISIIIESNTDIIGAISGKLGRLSGIRVKTAMLNINN